MKITEGIKAVEISFLIVFTWSVEIPINKEAFLLSLFGIGR